ncbi:ATP-binding protein [Streptomyces sp. NPDC056144]|uniref:ATP-binding protein n=1 Tax=unclassified Streptomyces TaxID=2593676 RepID=UPI0035DA54AD
MSPTLRTIPALRTVLCPVTPPPAPSPPRPTPLVYSLTLPGDPRSAAVARVAVGSALRAHGLDAYGLVVLLAVTELIATAARLTPGADLYVSLRHRADDALRIVVWDQHPTHRHDPDAETLCADRRRRSLWLLNAAVDDWGGEWGIHEEPQPPQRGTKSWVTLPR